MEKIQCPTCKAAYTEKEWNKNTQEIVNSLNNSDEPITPIAERKEGFLYRCPNPNCEDEVITNKNGSLTVQIAD